ncbi:Os06g0160800 [Oryza sativa Japonica Group]|uniref:Os06g0160800 protein n=2 Tax=Oryza sativa subsp. japonica TaxID=39947 RepID=Q0DEC7_ORYSJ|nr:unknown protein [Oryza sativa Japonica Group]BAF18796.1 Os06g0160800 [Oryza sativa Japonica Group]BAS96284.1 Os06g0160800 [Oryza sativa Japonica Group]|eukprot:NP_001056882.1 Os06g0160800 [Oryza sativa Japonica Group]
MEEDEMRMREKLATMDERQAMAMRLTWISELVASNKKSIAGNKAYILALIDAIDNDRCPYTAAELSDKIRELREDRVTVIKTMIDSVRAATPAAGGDGGTRRRGADDNSGAIGCGPTHQSRTISR